MIITTACIKILLGWIIICFSRAGRTNEGNRLTLQTKSKEFQRLHIGHIQCERVWFSCQNWLSWIFFDIFGIFQHCLCSPSKSSHYIQVVFQPKTFVCYFVIAMLKLIPRPLPPCSWGVPWPTSRSQCCRGWRRCASCQRNTPLHCRNHPWKRRLIESVIRDQ